jgi:hypothetical protein
MIKLTQLEPADLERYAHELLVLRHRVSLELTSEPERRLAALFESGVHRVFFPGRPHPC